MNFNRFVGIALLAMCVFTAGPVVTGVAFVGIVLTVKTVVWIANR